MSDFFKFYEQPAFDSPSLIVGWEQDAGRLSPKVIDYLNSKINGKCFCRLEPVGFFSLAGVAVENNVAQFPKGGFYTGRSRNLLIYKGSEPQFQRHKFLNALLDVAEHYCSAKELFTVGGTISPVAHTAPRKILAVYNQQDFQQKLRGYHLEDMTWQGPPALSSHLLWVAQQRGIPGAGLWSQVPFYLAAGRDFQAVRQTLSFFDKRFGLQMDFANLDEQVKRQNEKIARLTEEDPEINRCIQMLESNLSLSEEEQLELTKKVTRILEK